MKTRLLVTFVALICLGLIISNDLDEYNDFGNLNINKCKTMTIGIVGNPNPYLDEAFTQIKYDKNYINWVQQQGAVAVPISTFISDKELDAILEKVNGVLLPGGGVDLKPNGKFENFVMKIIDRVLVANEKGNGIALWGTCQGLEVINLLLSGAKTREEFFQQVYGMQNVTMTTVPYKKNMKKWDLGRYLFRRDLLESYTQEKVNCHLHDWSVPLSEYAEGKELNKYLYITSTQQDSKGNTYVDTFQSHYPYNIHGVQFHPDTLTDPTFYFNTFGKKNWELGIPVSKAMADFFIEKSRLSNYCLVGDKSRLIGFDDYRSSLVCSESYFYFENDKDHKSDDFKCNLELPDNNKNMRVKS